MIFTVETRVLMVPKSDSDVYEIEWKDSLTYRIVQ